MWVCVGDMLALARVTTRVYGSLRGYALRAYATLVHLGAWLCALRIRRFGAYVRYNRV